MSLWESYASLLRLWRTAHRIVADNHLSWEAKYNLIFSEDCSGRALFEWYCPDTSYEEDVMSFMNAFDSYVGQKYDGHFY